MYKNLFFDADGTLFDFDQAERNAFEILADTMGFPLTGQTRALYKDANGRCWKELEEGTITLAQLKVRRFELFFSDAGIEASGKQACECYEKALSSQGILYEESKPILHALRQRGYRLFLATNGIARVQRGRIARSGIGQWFEKIFISEEIGYPKPDPRFFSHMLRMTGLAGLETECLMIGDRLSSDIKGGLESGIDTLWLNWEGTDADGETRPTYECRSLWEIVPLLPPLY